MSTVRTTAMKLQYKKSLGGVDAGVS